MFIYNAHTYTVCYITHIHTHTYTHIHKTTSRHYIKTKRRIQIYRNGTATRPSYLLFVPPKLRQRSMFEILRA
jgi:hypothetical protein